MEQEKVFQHLTTGFTPKNAPGENILDDEEFFEEKIEEPSDDGEIVNEQDVISPKDSEDPESSEEEKVSGEVSEAESDDSDE
jgi:hypothetical protein